MNKIQEKIIEINEDFMMQLHVGMTEDEIITQNLIDIIEGVNDSETRSEKIIRWKNTIDNINKNLNANYEYPEELSLLLLEESVEQPINSNAFIDELFEIIDSLDNSEKYDNDDYYEDEYYEYDEDEYYEDEYYEYDNDPKVVYVEREVPVYKEAPRKPWGFWKTAAITAGTSYLSYKAGKKLGKSLM